MNPSSTVAGASPMYNGTEIVVRSVSRGTRHFVSVNYRLRPLGFPQGIEAGQRNNLDLGLYDQLAPLEWIQENIGKFGESAGAASISIHLRETRTRLHARATILESSHTAPTYAPEQNEASWQPYVAAIRACASTVGTNNNLDCIRSADFASLLQPLTTAQIFTNTTSFIPNRSYFSSTWIVWQCVKQPFSSNYTCFIPVGHSSDIIYVFNALLNKMPTAVSPMQG
ncbi:Alpha/Beta hydrolase protein [Flammula alnicola]|nr:Alpha/Beta hydrolase protein [Flammula alnicola]